MTERWVEIPGYPGYSVSNEGRVWNQKLNRELGGHRVDGRSRVSLKNENGGWDSYLKTQIVNSVDFAAAEALQVRRVRIVETGQIFDTVENLRSFLAADRSEVYKALRGNRQQIMGVTVEYFYDDSSHI